MKNLSPKEFEKRITPYECRKVASGEIMDVWVTGWGQHFTVCWTKDGLYDAEDCAVAMTMIAHSPPIEWRLKVAIEKLTTKIIGLRKDLQTKP